MVHRCDDRRREGTARTHLHHHHRQGAFRVQASRKWSKLPSANILGVCFFVSTVRLVAQ